MENERLLAVGRLDVFFGSLRFEAEMEVRVDVGFVNIAHG